jgi:hypothetical protein
MKIVKLLIKQKEYLLTETGNNIGCRKVEIIISWSKRLCKYILIVNVD